MAKEGVLPAVRDMFGVSGNDQLDAMELGDVYSLRVGSLRDLIAVEPDRDRCAQSLDLHSAPA